MFENVKGLTVGQHKAFLHELVQAFDDAGYNVRLPWHVLDAAHYGVPQHRERLILMGAKKGTRLAGLSDTADESGGREKARFPDFRKGPRAGRRSGICRTRIGFDALIESDSVRQAVRKAVRLCEGTALSHRGGVALRLSCADGTPSC